MMDNFLRQYPQDDEGWVSVSDLMAGLMMIFLLLVIIYAQQTLAQKEENQHIISENIALKLENRALFKEYSYYREELKRAGILNQAIISFKDTRIEIYRALREEFGSDLARWNAEIIPETLTIRFKAPEVLFETGSAELKPLFQAILSEFMPRYVNLLHTDFATSVSEIRIEGHTSSEWQDATSMLAAFEKNMELSQDRTREVLAYSLNMPETAYFQTWIIKVMTANGFSSSRPVLSVGSENKEASSRVEFRVQVNTEFLEFSSDDRNLKLEG